MTGTRIRNTREEFKVALIAAESGWRKELRSLIANPPDPEEFVYAMPDWMVAGLLTAQRRQSVYYLPREIGRKLGREGLCDVRTYALTAYGFAVWKILTEAEDA